MTPKERMAELVKKLREGAKLQDPAAKATVELVELMVEGLKESLVNGAGEDMLRLQGAARQLHNLHFMLTNEPPQITPVQE